MQFGSPSGTIINCTFEPPTFPAGLPAGQYRLVVKNSQGDASSFDVFDLITPLVGPAGPQGPIGPQGIPGPGVNLAGQNCGAFGLVSGFDGNGNIICRCAGAQFKASVTADVAGTFNVQSWPGGHQIFGGGNCRVDVSNPKGRIDLTAGGTAWSAFPLGWTTCTLNVQNAVCNTVGGIPNVIANFPTCTSALGANPSTDEADITCSP